MRCRNCDYTLWNLKARECPECGTPFRPGDFEFVANSVQFSCPHCDQSYYGTSDTGHLDPPAFSCVQCGRPIVMDQMVLRPTAGVQDEQTTPDNMPWLERSRLGFVRGWLRTIGMALIAPGRLIRAAPEGSSTGGAWWFAIFTQMSIMVALGLLLTCCFSVIFGLSGPGGGPGGIAAFSFGFGFGLAIFLAFTLMVTVIWGLVTHGLLRLGGNPNGTIGRTYQALCYASGANVLTAVPIFGGYIGWIWWLVSAVIMVKEGQGVSGPRAAFAVLAFPVLAIASFIIGYAILLTIVFSGVAAMGPVTGGGTPGGHMGSIASVLTQYAADHGGRVPSHAIELVEGGYLFVGDLISVDDWLESIEAAGQVPVADSTLREFEYLPDNRRRLTIQAAIDALPDDVVAHRLGDFVFTYHGIDDLAFADPHLWIVVWSPDPDRGAALAPGATLWVGLADGSSVALYFPMEEELAQQNALRSQLGLPLLPDPESVTHASPAVAGD